MNELSYIDFKKIVEELQFLVGGKIDQIYMPEKKQVLLQLHIPNLGKQLLMADVPNALYLTGFKPESKTPSGYCMFLRKKLSNARIQKISLLENERIVFFDLTTKNEVFHLYAEFFLKGNVILCNKDDLIISPLENQNWKDRTIRGGVDYTHIKKEDSELKSKLDKALVKFLATEFNLGGSYAEEICKRTGIDKFKENVSPNEIYKIKKELSKLNDEKPKGYVYLKKELNETNPITETNLKNNVQAISPFELEIYSHLNKKIYEKFNEALDSVLTEVTKKNISSSGNKQANLKKKKFLNIIEAQTKQLNSINRIIDESTKKGELIYKNYAVVKDVIEELNKAKKKYSWKDIQEKLMGHKIIKKIDEKNGKIFLELE